MLRRLASALWEQPDALDALYAEDFAVAADVWSATSFTELRREAVEADRWNRLHPTEDQRVPFVREAFGDRTGPYVAATDYMRAFADQIREWVPGRPSEVSDVLVLASTAALDPLGPGAGELVRRGRDLSRREGTPTPLPWFAVLEGGVRSRGGALRRRGRFPRGRARSGALRGSVAAAL